jgi:8-oxo-dGTP pyrophosphatase MutT (NUDIX family)
MAGEVAVVKWKGSYFLPGGGMLSGETAGQTIQREVREELDCEVRLLPKIGDAVQYFRAQDQYYRLEASFYAAEFVGEAGTAGEHQLYWLPPAEQANAFYHQCHAWAVGSLISR